MMRQREIFGLFAAAAVVVYAGIEVLAVPSSESLGIDSCDYDVRSAVKVKIFERVYFLPNNFVVEVYDKGLYVTSEGSLRATGAFENWPAASSDKKHWAMVMAPTSAWQTVHDFPEHIESGLKRNSTQVDGLNVAFFEESLVPGSPKQIQYAVVKNDDFFIIAYGEIARELKDGLPWCYAKGSDHQ